MGSKAAGPTPPPSHPPTAKASPALAALNSPSTSGRQSHRHGSSCCMRASGKRGARPPLAFAGSTNAIFSAPALSGATRSPCETNRCAIAFWLGSKHEPDRLEVARPQKKKRMRRVRRVTCGALPERRERRAAARLHNKKHDLTIQQRKNSCRWRMCLPSVSLQSRGRCLRRGCLFLVEVSTLGSKTTSAMHAY